MQKDLSQDKENMGFFLFGAAGPSSCQAMLDNMHAGMLILQEGNVLAKNKKLSALLGIAFEDITLSKIIDVLTKNSDNDLGNCIDKLKTGKSFDHFQASLTLPGNNIKTVEITSLPLPIQDKMGQQIFFRDLTREIQVEKELFETLNQFDSVFNSIDLAIFVLDADNFTLQNSNRAAETIFRIDRAARKGQTLWDYVANPADIDTVIHDVQNGGSKFEGLQYGFDMKRSDGSQFPALHTIQEVKNNNNKVIALMWIVSDMSQRVYLNRTLAEIETRYRILFNRGGDPTFIIDLESEEIIDANEAAEKMLGYTRIELIGKLILDITPPKRQQSLQSDFNKLKKESSITVQGLNLTKEGREIPIQTNMVVTSFGNRKVVIAASRDISEQMKMEAERLRLERLDAVRQVAGGIAHELTQPLQTLVTIADIIEEESAPLEQKISLIHKVPPLVERMSLLITQMKSLVRLALKPYVKRQEILDFRQSAHCVKILVLGDNGILDGKLHRISWIRSIETESVSDWASALMCLEYDSYDCLICTCPSTTPEGMEFFKTIGLQYPDLHIIHYLSDDDGETFLTETEIITTLDEISKTDRLSSPQISD